MRGAGEVPREDDAAVESRLKIFLNSCQREMKEEKGV